MVRRELRGPRAARPQGHAHAASLPASEYQTIDIVETEQYGVTLLLDGAYMTSVARRVPLPRDDRPSGADHARRRSSACWSSAAATAAPCARCCATARSSRSRCARSTGWSSRRASSTCRVQRAVERPAPRRCASATAWRYLRDYTGEPFDVILVDGSDPVGPAEGLFDEPVLRELPSAASRRTACSRRRPRRRS